MFLWNVCCEMRCAVKLSRAVGLCRTRKQESLPDTLAQTGGVPILVWRSEIALIHLLCDNV
eukprot:SAG31_NODE_439_length_15675_cov_6.578390_12_plen_61_part_00